MSSAIDNAKDVSECNNERLDVSVHKLLPIPLINPVVKATPDNFRNTIQAFVNTVKKGSSYTITKICEEFKFQRRRLYDVINVLESVGCCKKASIDSIIWKGIDGITPMLLEQQEIYRINRLDVRLGDLFQEERCISIGHLTIVYMMMFFALRQQGLDLRAIAVYLSRNNGRFKTTLCKLYQISHILEAAGIIRRGILAGETSLCDRFFKFAAPDSAGRLMSISMLLNRPRDDLVDWVEQRRKEFADTVKALDMKASPAVLPPNVVPMPIYLYA